MLIDGNEIQLGADEQVTITKLFGPTHFGTDLRVTACMNLGAARTGSPHRYNPGWRIEKLYTVDDDERGPRVVARHVATISAEDEEPKP